jgi:hypothetical protein
MEIYVNMILKLVQTGTHKIDEILYYVTAQLNLIDKVRVAMFVTWIWALFGLYVAKAFEGFFRLILKMPDSWLVFAAPSAQKINEKESVKIVSAHDGKADITNKFKLFLKYYWEEDELNGGFSFDSFRKLLNCSMLYCSYLMTDKKGEITPEKFWRNVDRFLVEMREDSCVKYTDASLTQSKTLPFNMVPFNNIPENRTFARQDLINLINSINS